MNFLKPVYFVFIWMAVLYFSMEFLSFICILSAIIIASWLYFKRAKGKFNFDKCVFISGCDSGLGLRTALFLHNLDCTVFAGCLYPDGNGASLLKALDSEKLKVVPLNITDEKSIENAAEFVKNELGHQSLVLINNAGVCICGEFDWLPWKHCSQQLDVNLLGTIRMTKIFLPLIRKSKGRIINITSINGKIAYPGISIYCATKFALEAFSDSLRYELEKFGVKVIVIEPGDFAAHTNIMSNQEKYFKEMWNELDEEKKELYKDYFRKYHKIALKNAGISSPKSIESSDFLETIKESVFIAYPLPRYLVCSTISKFFYTLFRLLPTTVADQLVYFILRKAFCLKFNKN